MIVAMERIRIAGPKELLPEVAALLQEQGTVHIDSADEEMARVRDGLPTARRLVPDAGARERRERIEGILGRLRTLLLLLPPVPPDGAGAGRGTAPPPPAGALPPSLEELSRTVASLLSRAEALARKRKVHEEELSLFGRYEKVLRVLSPLIAGVRESGDLEFIGVALQAREREAIPVLEEELSRATGGHCEILFREADRETVAGLLVFPRERAGAAKEILRERNVGELRMPPSVADRPLPEALAIVRRKEALLPRRMARIDGELLSLARRWAEHLAAWRRELESRLERIRVSEEFFESRSAFVLCGWIPRDSLPPLAEALAGRHGELVVLERLPVGRRDEETAPVALRNGPFARPFERFTRALPLPRYGTIDPTPLVAVFFPLFYGAIIGDVGYGLLLLVLSAAVRLRCGANPLVRDYATIFLWASLSATAWGFAYGEFLGDLGERWGMEPLLLDRMDDFVRNMQVALAIGAAHVLLGICLGIAVALRRGERRAAAAKGIGLLLVLSAIALALSLAGALPRAAALAGGTGMALAVPALLLLSSHAAVMELHNLVNVLSYLRIMGIGVASVSLAFAANRLAGLPESPVAGFLAAAALHAVNVAFGVFSPAIQSLRLHYVEFFENFFVGGGRPYAPFRTTS